LSEKQEERALNWNWEKTYSEKRTTPEKAVEIIKSGDRVVAGQSAAMPEALNNALAARKEQLTGVTLITALALRPMAAMRPECKPHIETLSFFMGPQERMLDKAVGGAVSVNFHQLDLWMERVGRPDVLMLEVTPPDKAGYFNVGNVNCCVMEDYLRSKPKIIVQVNKHVPFIYSDFGFLHVDDVEAIIEHDAPMPELPNSPPTEIDKQIASHIIDRIPDGACLQIGLGGIGNAVGYSLDNKKDLGIHTEMATDSMIYLAKKGAINCSKKNYYPGKFVAAMGLGSQEMYDFMDHNPFVYATTLSRVSREEYVAMNDNFISINNCLSVDLTGQVCSETIGHSRVSTTGGQQGFVRGAIRSKGGKSFILLASTAETKTGKVSRISAALPAGTVVTTPRSDVQYIGTEFGCVDLFGKPPCERAKLLIGIAHPDFREQLTQEAKQAGILV
jgi:4-hydroxybutyrate CoA-transferase